MPNLNEILNKELEQGFEVKIKGNNGKGIVEAKASRIGMLCAFTTLYKALREQGIEEEEIEYALKGAKKTDKELKEDILKELHRMMSELFDF